MRRRFPIGAVLGLLFATVPAAARAQATIRVSAGGQTREYAPLGTPAAYSVDALRALGADVAPARGGFRAILLGDTLRFWTGSPYFTVRGAVTQLTHPVTAENGDFRIPAQFFVDWLPSAFGGRVALAQGVLTNTEAKAPPRMATPAPTGRTGAPPAPGPRIVILDPGHGGNDPGKIGPNGQREKDEVLRLARALEKELKDRDYEVHLTRATDTLIALDDRPHMANQWKAGRPAAVFVSLHFNSYAQRSVRGFETFFLSQARTDDERRVAEMENAAAAFEDGPARPASAEEAILNGLRNDFYLRASNDLAEDVQASIRRVHDGPDRGVKRAGFRVLVGALMPAVLVEAAFISNPTEARAIASTKFRGDIARSVADAIDRFFDEHEHLWTAGGS